LYICKKISDFIKNTETASDIALRGTGYTQFTQLQLQIIYKSQITQNCWICHVCEWNGITICWARESWFWFRLVYPQFIVMLCHWKLPISKQWYGCQARRCRVDC